MRAHVVKRLANIPLTVVGADVSWDDMALKHSAIVGKRRFFQGPSATAHSGCHRPSPPMTAMTR